MQFLCRDSWGKKSKRWHCAYRKLFRGSDQSTPDKKVDKRTSPFYCKAVRFHAYFQSNSGLFALPNSNYKELNGTKIENPHLFHKLQLHVSRSWKRWITINTKNAGLFFFLFALREVLSAVCFLQKNCCLKKKKLLLNNYTFRRRRDCDTALR